jgi:hypothetical protein
MSLITTTAALADACARLAKHPFVTVDTEFLRETTYYPKLCLIQLASPDEAVLVDPLSPDLDLTPFLLLMANRHVVKVFHAARQDLEIVWIIGKLIPAPLFDTQVAAMAIRSATSSSPTTSPRRGSTSRRALPTGRAGRSARRSSPMPSRTSLICAMSIWRSMPTSGRAAARPGSPRKCRC